MTDDETQAWAQAGRRIQAFADDLGVKGFDVLVRWDRPHGRVDVVITVREAP